MKTAYIIILIMVAQVVLAFSGGIDIKSKIDKIQVSEMGKTIINNNIAAVKSHNKEAYINKFEAKSGEKIDLETIGKISNICFQFVVPTSKIQITLNKKNALWFDTNLDDKINIDNTEICYEGLGLDSSELDYTIVYTGTGKTKYNISFDGVILDPYVIGNLNASNYLNLYLPFNGNINATWNSISMSLNTSNTRFNDTENWAYIGSASSPQYGYDENWASYASLLHVGYSHTYWFNYSRTAIDTGAIIQKKDAISAGSTGSGSKTCYNAGLVNYTVPQECIDYDTSNVRIKINMFCGTSEAGIYYYCEGSSGYTLISQTYCPSGGDSITDCEEDLYETGVYITNQSNYVAYTQGVVPTALVNNRSLVAGYAFSVYNSSYDLMNIYNGADTSVVYNVSGATFNGVSSKINLTNQLELGNTYNNFTVYSKYNYMPVQSGSSEHLIGSMASGWEKGWQIQITNTTDTFYCTSSSGVPGYSTSVNVDNLAGQHSIAIVVRNVYGVA